MITDKQRKERMNYLGSTDMAAILGVSPWANSYDVWLEKTGKVIMNKQSESLLAGSIFERSVLDWAEQKLGPLRRDEDDGKGGRQNIELKCIGFPIVDHPDALVIKSGNPVEGKTAGLFGPLTENYGEGEDELPDRVIVQCHVHMLAANKEVCHVPVFLGGRGFVMYQVLWDEVIGNAIKDAALDFWECVENDEPPANVVPSVEFAKKIKREPNKIVEIDSALVETWLENKDKVKWATAILEDSIGAIFKALGDAEAGTCTLGMVTYFMQSQKRIDSTRLIEEKPEIAKEYTKESKFRVLRLKKAKKEKFDMEI